MHANVWGSNGTWQLDSLQEQLLRVLLSFIASLLHKYPSLSAVCVEPNCMSAFLTTGATDANLPLLVHACCLKIQAAEYHNTLMYHKVQQHCTCDCYLMLASCPNAEVSRCHPQELDQAMMQLLPVYQSPQPALVTKGIALSNIDLPQVQPHLVQPLLLSMLKDTFTHPALHMQPGSQPPPQHNELETLSSCMHWFHRTLQLAMHSEQAHDLVICSKHFTGLHSDMFSLAEARDVMQSALQLLFLVCKNMQQQCEVSTLEGFAVTKSMARLLRAPGYETFCDCHQSCYRQWQ